MRNRIFGMIGVLWGGFIILRLVREGIMPGPDRAFVVGQYLGAGLGVLMLVAGGYYLVKGEGTRSKRKKKRKKVAGSRFGGHGA